MASSPEPTRLARLPPFAWLVIVIVALSATYAVVQVALVRPYLWPAGMGATMAGDPSAQLPLKARPPDVRTDFAPTPRITSVADGSPAEAEGLVPGDRITAMRDISAVSGTEHRVRCDARYRGQTDRGVAHVLLDGRERAARDIDRIGERWRPARSTRTPAGVAIECRRMGAAPCRHDRAGRRLRRRRRDSPADAELRPDSRPLRAGAGAQRRRRRRTVARRREGHSDPGQGAHGVRLDREPARLSDHRAGDPLLPHTVTPARSLSVAARGAVTGRAAADRSCVDDGALSGRRRCSQRRRACGTPHIQPSISRHSPAHLASTSLRSSRGRIAIASITTRTSGGASAWRSTPPSPACSRTWCEMACRSSRRSPDATAQSIRPR